MVNIKISYQSRRLKGRLDIKNRTLLQWFAFLVAFWSVIFNLVNHLPGVFSVLKYIPDGMLLALLILMLMRNHVTVRRPVLPMLCLAVGLFFYTLVMYLMNYQSIAYYLWGFRNNFRFFIAFFAFTAYLDERDVTTWLKTMDILFWINAVLSVFQFFVLHVNQDNLGGIFGIFGGTNGYTQCFMSIVIGKSLLDTFDGKEKISVSMSKCVAAILVAAMAELKFFFFVLVFLMMVAAVMTRFSIKKVIYLMLALIAVVIGTMLLVEWFDEFKGFFDLKNLWETATKKNYSTQNDINRLSAIPTLSRKILTNPLDQLFGLGMGNCDTSAYAICNTPFYQQYAHLHYNFFSSAMIFLEMGYVGLVLYIGFFVACFVQIYKQYKAKRGNVLYNRLALLMVMLCCVLVVYDASMRIESAYMMYFVLAMPFIQSKPQTIRREEKGITT